MLGFDRITFDPEVMGGRACIRGIRVTVSLIVNLTANGMTPEEIVEAYPYLEAEDVTQSLRYAALAGGGASASSRAHRLVNGAREEAYGTAADQTGLPSSLRLRTARPAGYLNRTPSCTVRNRVSESSWTWWRSAPSSRLNGALSGSRPPNPRLKPRSPEPDLGL